MSERETADDELLARRIARGLSRALAREGWTSLLEVPLASGRRADLLALSDDGRFLLVEIKSSAADFRSDRKWPEYLEWCDLFAFAVAEDFPFDLLPAEPGIYVADAYDAALRRPLQMAPAMAPARRKALTLRFARLAAERLRREYDPGV
ncbi:MAG: MmcB family DNA repair protein [Tagaea sp.]